MRNFALARSKPIGTVNDVAPTTTDPPEAELYKVARGTTLIIVPHSPEGIGQTANMTVYEKCETPTGSHVWVNSTAVAITTGRIYAHDDVSPGAEVWIGFDTINAASTRPVRLQVYVTEKA